MRESRAAPKRKRKVRRGSATPLRPLLRVGQPPGTAVKSAWHLGLGEPWGQPLSMGSIWVGQAGVTPGAKSPEPRAWGGAMDAERTPEKGPGKTACRTEDAGLIWPRGSELPQQPQPATI